MNKQLIETTIDKQIPKELWLTLGGNPLEPAETFGASDAFIATRIPESQKSALTKRVDWEAGKVFYPWSPGLDSKDYPFYCVNQNVLYICISNNPNNNEAESGDYLTQNAPTHKSALPVTYSDGYTWLSLWYLDYTKETFLTDTDLPIPTFEINKPKNTYSNFYGAVCVTGITTSGTCCLYYKDNTTDNATGITYEAGDLYYAGANSPCYQCYEIANKLNYEFKFKPNSAGITGVCDTSVTFKGLKDYLEENKNSIPPNTSSSVQLTLLKEYDSVYEGIMRASINLKDVEESLLIMPTENPSLVISDPHAETLCEVKLKTTKLSDTQYKVIGIELVSQGKNHIFPSFTIENNTSSTLIDYITLIPYPTNIFTDPALLLPVSSYAVNAYVNVGEIKEKSFNDKFTKVALATQLKTRKDLALVEYAPDVAITQNLQTSFLARITDTSSGSETDIASAELIAPPQEDWNNCLSPRPEDCYVARNRTTNNYDFYISAIITGKNLVSGKNYGYIQDPATGNYVPGFKVEINDFTDNTVPVVKVNDKLTILGNTCRVFKVTEPTLSKQTEFLSSGNIDLDIKNLNSSVNLAFSFKINT